MSERARRKLAGSKRPKSKLGLPDLDHSKTAVLDSLRSPESKRGYRYAIDEFIRWYCSEPRLSFNKVVVTRFGIFLENRGLAPAMDHLRLADQSEVFPDSVLVRTAQAIVWTGPRSGWSGIRRISHAV
jgi:hypothetical protein